MKKELNKFIKSFDCRWRRLKEESRIKIRSFSILIFTAFLSPFIFAIGSWDLAKGAQVGDMFGSLNSLFSGIALLGAIVAIFLQANELYLQKEELKLTRDEIRQTNDQFKIQNDLLKVQFQAAEQVRIAAEAKEKNAALPYFFIAASGIDPSKFPWFSLVNQGAKAYEIIIEILDSDLTRTKQVNIQKWNVEQSETIFSNINSGTLQIRFRTTTGHTETILFKFSGILISRII